MDSANTQSAYRPVSLPVRSAALLIVLTASGLALGQSNDEQRRAAYRARMESILLKEERAMALRPQRRDTPIRAENITAVEARQVQAVTAEALPGAMVSISAVVTGCPCEDGLMCTDQVWVVPHRPDARLGLLLSKIGGEWVIGPVQRWWLEYEKLEERQKNYRKGWDFWKARDALLERFPACLGDPDDAPK